MTGVASEQGGAGLLESDVPPDIHRRTACCHGLASSAAIGSGGSSAAASRRVEVAPWQMLCRLRGSRLCVKRRRPPFLMDVNINDR
jgi:hypothetical protein